MIPNNKKGPIMKHVNANFFELKGTNYEIGTQLGHMILAHPHLKEIFLSSSKAISEGDPYIYELFDQYCPGLKDELQGFADLLGRSGTESMAFISP